MNAHTPTSISSKPIKVLPWPVSGMLLPVRMKRLTETAILPGYATPAAAGMDLHADLGDVEGQLIIQPGERRLVKTGIAIALTLHVEAQVRPRSGLALKHGITVLNSPGTIDGDYRGDIGVILFNASHQQFVVRHGDRIAQLVIAPVLRVTLEEVEELDETARGDGAFGSTGISTAIDPSRIKVGTLSLSDVRIEGDASLLGHPIASQLHAGDRR